ncbi:microtubule-associated protein futsch-like [Littorina saxatilis]|uniref:Uncharacterized protein n=1 Tax=Littorina saxatilis TaxID=31220 RepID=A0AAN9B209_9CAEN
MAAKLPPVKKTKKSSYKPLSKLNEDNLTELKRVDKPEYTSRVFFYNTSSRNRLVHDVNVWFRDHQHTMSLINRQQRAVCKMQSRVQKDMHRAKINGYKRRQQAMRDGMKKMQEQLAVELLQRRVIQRFRRNASEKLASRGQESISGRRLMAQRRAYLSESPDTEQPMSRQDPAAMLGSIIDFAAIVAGSSEEVEDATAKVNAAEESRDTRPGSNKDTAEGSLTEKKPVPKSKRRASEPGKSSGMNRSDLSQMQNQNKSVRRLSEPEAPRPSQVCRPLDLPLQMSRQRSPKPSAGLNETSLDVIPEVTSPTETPPEGEQSTQEEKTRSEVSINSRVVEVRKDRPYSPPTRKITSGMGNTDDKKLHTTKEGSHDSINHHEQPPNHPEQSVAANSNRFVSGLNSTPFSSIMESEEDILNEISYARDLDEPQSVSFGSVPSRDRAMQDAAMFLSVQEAISEDEKQGIAKGKKSMAAQIRLERKHEARKRAKLLDSEPMVQYYRSVRGNLQPLMMEPSRRSFPLPRGKGRYQQTKLLREEQQRDLARRGDIDKFFTDLFARQIGEPKPPAAAESDNKVSDTPKGNQLELLLRRMKKRSLGLTGSVDRNSVEQLAKCQYLRVYDWESKTKGKEEGESVRMTSWANAESRLKAGFLALNLTRHN